MKLFLFSIITLALSSCAAFQSTDPNSLAFSIPEGSTLTLNQPISYAGNVTHAVVQFGKEITDSDRQFYEINCRVDFKAFGPRTIEPEDFVITRTEDGQNWVSQPAIMRYYTEVYLASSKNTDVIKMVCQLYGDGSDRNFTVEEMQVALGDLITLKFKKQNKAPDKTSER